MKQAIRQPRPLGLTLIANKIHLHKTTNNPIPIELTERIIQYLLSNDLYINGKQLSLQDLAAYLDLPFITIIKAYKSYTNKASKVMGNWDTGAINFSVLANFLKASSDVSKQASTLERAQGGKYVPFLTNSYNEILLTQLNAVKVFADLAKLVSNSSGPIRPNLDHQSQSNSAIKSIGVNEALSLLQDKGMLEITWDEKDYQDISTKHHISTLPEVRANLQIGNAEDAKYMEEKKDNKKHHRTRRVNENNLDEEEII